MDPFGYSEERKLERHLIRDYEKTIKTLLVNISRENEMIGLEIANLPDQIRGFGPVKEKAAYEALARTKTLLEGLKNPVVKNVKKREPAI